MLRVPTPDEEDRRRRVRERKALINEQIRHVNRVTGLLFSQGISGYEPLNRDRRERLDRLKPVMAARFGLTPSAKLAAIVGEKDLPRSEVVSKVWDYIKKHDLQDAKDRRQINADDKLEKVFGKKSASMFEMNKHLRAHLTSKKA